MNTSRPSLSNTTSHLVTSKHDVKYRRIPRIISRRVYRYRRKIHLQHLKQSYNENYLKYERDFLPETLDLLNLEETVLKFLVKYPTRRSYSTDDDPLTVFHTEMNKSAFFNHSLMKRRYSVPETVMRKHKLQEKLMKRKTTDTSNENREKVLNNINDYEIDTKDESCQTDECHTLKNYFKLNSSFKKSLRCRRRDSVRNFRKFNSYCQYKTLSTLHKKMINKCKEMQNFNFIKAKNNIKNEYNEYEIENLTMSNQVLKKKQTAQNYLTFKTDDVDFKSNNKRINTKNVKLFVDNINKLKKSYSDNYIYSNKRLSPIIRRSSYPLNHNLTHKSTYEFDVLKCNARSKKLNEINNSFLESKVISVEDENKIKNNEFAFDVHPKKKLFIHCDKSLDQSTSGYNTVSGSLYGTPRKKTPETPKLSSENQQKDEKQHSNTSGKEKKTEHPAFPITFHSESIFLHPYENGFLSHKELHHINIQLVSSDTKLYYENKNERNSSANDRYKTEIKLNVNENEITKIKKSDTENLKENNIRIQRNFINEIPSDNLHRRKYTETSKESNINQLQMGLSLETSSQNSYQNNKNLKEDPQLRKQIKNENDTSVNKQLDPLEVNNSLNKKGLYNIFVDSEDCSVPTDDYLLEADTDQSKLKIEVDVTDINLSNSLHNILLGRNTKYTTNDHQDSRITEIEMDENQSRYGCNEKNKLKSKTALNYLFQKLGNSYPKRSLLKQPIFNGNYSQYGKYYSDLLPKIQYSEIPQKVLFNNQTYDILSGNLLPNEWPNALSTKYEQECATENIINSSIKLPERNDTGEHLSDSDISIPDSLEDFQHSASTRCNEYEKYDEKLTRRDVCNLKTNIITPKKCKESISYFINFGESQRKKYTMPSALRERLNKRNKSISKHSLCVEMQKKSLKCKKLIHKQIQTCLNVENNLKNRRKRLINGTKNKSIKICKDASSNEQKDNNIPVESDLDEKIMNILLSGLHMQNKEREVKNSKRDDTDISTSKIYNTLSRSVQTKNLNQNYESQIISEYTEMFKISTPVDDTNNVPSNERDEFYKSEKDQQSMFFEQESLTPDENNLYEATLSEEVGKINSNNYYRSIKTSRKVYYPMKIVDKYHLYNCNKDINLTPSISPQNQSGQSFSKYQTKLKEFKHQMKKQNLNKVNVNYLNNVPNDTSYFEKFTKENGVAPIHYTRIRDKFKVKNQILKISATRSHKFHQKFEAIPEELSNNSSEIIDHAQVYTNSESESAFSRTNELGKNEMREKNNLNTNGFDINQNKAISAEVDANLNKNYNNEKILINTDENRNEIQNVNTNFNEIEEERNEYTDKLKSQKGKNSLSSIQEQEELITLSRGWINFYLLKGNTEEIEDENVTLSETHHIPQQYLVHVQASPNISNEHMPKSTTLPGLCQSIKNRSHKTSKIKHADKTSLPDITNVSSYLHQKSIDTSSFKNHSLRNPLPKLHHLSSEESEICSCKSEDTNSYNDLTAEPVSTDLSIEKSSPIITSSNHSQSSPEELSERNNVKNLQRCRHPHTYHSMKDNQWSLTIKGSRSTCEKKLSSDIEMQLSLQHQDPSNHSWKFTMKNEDIEMSSSNSFESHNTNRNHLPSYFNVNYKMLPFSIYHHENASFSDNNSRNNSELSFNNKKDVFKINSNSTSRNIKRLNRDTKFQIKKSDDDLAITGSTITPERKPRVPKMSERDLTRMKNYTSHEKIKI